MELRPVQGSSDRVLVQFETELEDEMFNPNQLRRTGRKILERVKIVPPREYPYLRVFSVEALHHREEVVHANNCGFRNDFSPAVLEVRQLLHDKVMEFGTDLREVEQVNWPPYER